MCASPATGTNDSQASSSAGSFNSQVPASNQLASGGGSETDSDWDRYTSQDEDEFDETLLERRRARVAHVDSAVRQREQSLFGLTDKRIPAPLK